MNIDSNRPSAYSGTLGWDIWSRKKTEPALLVKAWRDLYSLTAEWRGEGRIKTDWDPRAVDLCRMTEQVETPFVADGTKQNSQLLSRTVCFYKDGVCLATMTYSGVQAHKKKNVWLVNFAVVYTMSTGALPVLYLPPEDFKPYEVLGCLRSFMVVERPTFPDQILDPAGLRPGMKIGVQTIANTMKRRTTLTIAEIHFVENWISFEEWREGVGWQGEDNQGVPQRYTFGDLGLAAYSDGSWHKVHHCYQA